MKNFSITRVVTKDLITDSFQGIRNLFGLRLRGYEAMINKHLKEVIKEMESKYIPLWWRLSINPLVNGSVMITVYGEVDEK
jgi:hypothetical protein